MVDVSSQSLPQTLPNRVLEQAKRGEPKLRLHILDSIRGWASIQVMFSHTCQQMFTHKLPEFGPYWISFFDGSFAVAIFFVLSGEALSHAYFVTHDLNEIRKLAIKRYIRLTIPIFVSCLIIFLLMKTHLTYFHEAIALSGADAPTKSFILFEPTVSSFLIFSVFGVYFNNTFEASYNPVLWSMSVELFGSMFIFLVLFLTKNRAQRWSLFAILTPFIVIFAPYFLCFMAGMVFGELRVGGTFKRLSAHPAANALGIAAVFSVAFSLTIIPIIGVHHGVVYALCGGAAVILFAIYSSPWLQKLFDNRLAHFLGEMSFPIYLVHFALIISLESYLVLRLFPDGIVTRGPAYLIMAVTLAATLLVASIFVRVERFAIKASNSFFAFIDRL
jgi:peptidoglycan/LPS O-acetylase OafA/YrhL